MFGRLPRRRSPIQRLALVLGQLVQLLRLAMPNIHFSNAAVLFLVYFHQSDGTVAYVFSCEAGEVRKLKGGKGRGKETNHPSLSTLSGNPPDL